MSAPSKPSSVWKAKQSGWEAEPSLPQRCCWSWMGAAGREGKEKQLPVLGTRVRRERAPRGSSPLSGHSFTHPATAKGSTALLGAGECPTPKHCWAGQILRKEPKTSIKEMGKQRVPREVILLPSPGAQPQGKKWPKWISSIPTPGAVPFTCESPKPTRSSAKVENFTRMSDIPGPALLQHPKISTNLRSLLPSAPPTPLLLPDLGCSPSTGCGDTWDTQGGTWDIQGGMWDIQEMWDTQRVLWDTEGQMWDTQEGHGTPKKGHGTPRERCETRRRCVTSKD